MPFLVFYFYVIWVQYNCWHLIAQLKTWCALKTWFGFNIILLLASFLFAAKIFWILRNRNMTCLGNENRSNTRLSFNIIGMVDTLKTCYPCNTNSTEEDKFVKWNNNNHSCLILNVGRSCRGSHRLWRILKK